MNYFVRTEKCLVKKGKNCRSLDYFKPLVGLKKFWLDEQNIVSINEILVEMTKFLLDKQNTVCINEILVKMTKF